LFLFCFLLKTLGLFFQHYEIQMNLPGGQIAVNEI
jgi:hypothetical protein